MGYESYHNTIETLIGSSAAWVACGEEAIGGDGSCLKNPICPTKAF